MRVRTKICGITRLADARAAVAAGCDAVGFNFYRSSPRYVSPQQVREIIAALPPFVTAVGLFVDHSTREVREAAEQAGVGLLQFQGDETDAQCAAAGFPFIKAVRIAGPIDADAIAQQYPTASALLLDAWLPGQVGGTGHTFDWAWWPSACTKPLILAGGLTAENVAGAIDRTRPYAVDVCSGVESAVKGVKDEAKLKQFMIEVQRAQRGN